MRYLLLQLIKLYWKIFPEKARKKCIFKESCSHFVYNKTAEGGFIIGLKAFKKRYKQCRPGYRYIDLPNGEKVVLLADGSIVDEIELRPE